AIFLKGYQWPFDPKKVPELGSSLVDLLVYRETEVLGRRVCMDFRANLGESFDLADYGAETREYLEKSGATQALPLERLAHMNQPAIDLYADHGIDLTRERLEIAVCAQHTNGGLVGDCWWQSPLPGLYPVGEVNGSHGVYRPGGSALNSGQCGSLRAAQHIAARGVEAPDPEAFLRAAGADLDAFAERLERFATAPGDAGALRTEIQTRMTRAAGHIRTAPAVAAALPEATALLARLRAEGGAGGGLCEAFENYHLAVASVAYLAALGEYLDGGGGSRGSALVLDDEGEPLHEALPPEWRMRPDDPALGESICEVRLDADLTPQTTRVPVRPIPDETFWFENVWNDYRAGRVYD
ncbi:MAG: oxidoreductase, partial [Planctomycetota bacterium]